MDDFQIVYWQHSKQPLRMPQIHKFRHPSPHGSTNRGGAIFCRVHSESPTRIPIKGGSSASKIRGDEGAAPSHVI